MISHNLLQVAIKTAHRLIIIYSMTNGAWRRGSIMLRTENSERPGLQQHFVGWSCRRHWAKKVIHLCPSKVCLQRYASGCLLVSGLGSCRKHISAYSYCRCCPEHCFSNCWNCLDWTSERCVLPALLLEFSLSIWWTHCIHRVVHLVIDGVHLCFGLLLGLSFNGGQFDCCKEIQAL